MAASYQLLYSCSTRAIQKKPNPQQNIFEFSEKSQANQPLVIAEK